MKHCAGNKTYEHYNAMAKFADKKLGERGGKRVHPLGMGDDDANLEDDFITWKVGRGVARIYPSGGGHMFTYISIC